MFSDGVKEIYDIFQIVSVDKNDQTAHLQTRMTVKQGGRMVLDDDTVDRYSKLFYQNSADLPFLAYNLGGQKIVLQSVMRKDVKKAFILNIPEDERFVSFVNFNQF